MEALFLSFAPAIIYVLVIFALLVKNRTAVFINRRLAIFSAFALPFYPIIALFISVKLSHDTSMALLTIFYGAMFYYPIATSLLIIFMLFTRYKWFVGLGVFLCAVPVIAGLLGFFKDISPC